MTSTKEGGRKPVPQEPGGIRHPQSACHLSRVPARCDVSVSCNQERYWKLCCNLLIYRAELLSSPHYLPGFSRCFWCFVIVLEDAFQSVLKQELRYSSAAKGHKKGCVLAFAGGFCCSPAGVLSVPILCFSPLRLDVQEPVLYFRRPSCILCRYLRESSPRGPLPWEMWENHLWVSSREAVVLTTCLGTMLCDW